MLCLTLPDIDGKDSGAHQFFSCSELTANSFTQLQLLGTLYPLRNLTMLCVTPDCFFEYMRPRLQEKETAFLPWTTHNQNTFEILNPCLLTFDNTSNKDSFITNIKKINPFISTDESFSILLPIQICRPP